jgi:hypothetical protein
MEFTRQFVEMFGKCEAPQSYLRWSAISGAGAMLGRRAYLNFGHSKIYPNNYVLLIGQPGSRKGTGMSGITNIMKEAGYQKFAPTRSRKEALWEYMATTAEAAVVEQLSPDGELEVISIDTLLDTQVPAETFILAPELIDFTGINDEELINSLTNMWDCLDSFTNPRTTKNNIKLYQPTLSMLGGTTPSSFTKIVPPSALGGGFMRRLLLIYGERMQKIAFPDAVDLNIKAQLVDCFENMGSLFNFEIKLTPKAIDVLTRIYEHPHFLRDRRFVYYLEVRFTHLLKMLIISAAAADKDTIAVKDVVYCNTLLARAELYMPHALSNYGYAWNSQISSAVLDTLRHTTKPLPLRELYRQVITDVGNMETLQKIVKTFVEADLVQTVNIRGQRAYLSKHSLAEKFHRMPYIDQDFLLEDEKV